MGFSHIFSEDYVQFWLFGISLNTLGQKLYQRNVLNRVIVTAIGPDIINMLFLRSFSDQFQRVEGNNNLKKETVQKLHENAFF